MQLAFWNFPPVECLEIASQALGIEAERQSASVCVELLSQQQVDLALLPVITALSAADELDIVPGGAVSSWGYPFARMCAQRDFWKAETLRSTTGPKLLEFMARVILKEHYGQDVQVVSHENADVELLSECASLERSADPRTLDIGQEWYELAQYPMVWGVYCCLKGTATDAMTQQLIELTKEAEKISQNHELHSSSPKDEFFRNSLRLRLDDVAIAGLTAIRDYMFFYGVTQELLPISILKPELAQQAPWWGQDSVYPEEETP